MQGTLAVLSPCRTLPAVEQFIEFALSPRGQMAIEASGTYPLNSNQRAIGELVLARIKK